MDALHGPFLSIDTRLNLILFVQIKMCLFSLQANSSTEVFPANKTLIL